MKVLISILLISLVDGFSVNPSSSHSSTSRVVQQEQQLRKTTPLHMVGAADEYQNALKQAQKEMMMGADVPKPDKEMEARLNKLERMEKELEQRLQTLGKVGSKPDPKDPSSRSSISPQSKVRGVSEIWENSSPTTVQGGSLRTWSYANPAVKRVYVLLKTDGRPLNSDIELWQGPDNTPHKMKVYVEDGGKRTFAAFVDTPRSPNSICIKNTGHLEFPLYACVGPDDAAGDACLAVMDEVRAEVIQGGALRTYPFDPNVDSVAVVITTDGRPLNARLELLQGPNNNKQIIELYTEDGLDRPFMAIIQTPGSGNVVRVVNTAPIEFPMYATVGAYELISDDAYYNDGVQLGQEW